MRLAFSVYGAESYVVGDDWPAMHTLAQAIELEADKVAAEANADHLEDNTDECRDALRTQVIEDATRALQEIGDTYTDPIGVTWSLHP